MISALGSLAFQATVEYDCSGTHYSISSNLVNYSASYCAGDFIADYAGDIDNAWSNMKTSSAQNPGTKYEYGFTVNFDGTQYNKVDLPVATAACSAQIISATVNYSVPYGADPRPGFSASVFYVAQLHVHPTLTYCNVPNLNITVPPGPSVSPYDLKQPYPPFPMVVRTYSQTENQGQNINDPYQDYQYGNQCTTYFP